MSLISDKYDHLAPEVRLFVEDATNFLAKDFSSVVSFYQGDSQNALVFDKLSDLLLRYKSTTASMIAYRDAFNNASDWEVLEFVEELGVKLNTTKNVWKYTRSSSVLSSYFPSSIQRPLRSNETVERFAKDAVKSENPENDWAEIAVLNMMREEDYDITGGFLLKASLSDRSQNSILNAVVGPLDGDKILGQDIDRIITFVDDDIKVLSAKDTFEQTTNILLSLRMGDNPQFPEDGISQRIIGSNINSFMYPLVFRQMQSTFGKDDTIASIAVKNLSHVEDVVIIELLVVSQMGVILEKQFNL